jgi:hypothetical protein
VAEAVDEQCGSERAVYQASTEVGFELVMLRVGLPRQFSGTRSPDRHEYVSKALR